MDLTLFQASQTVFTLKEVALFSPSVSADNLKGRLFYLAKTGRLKHLRRGIYAKPSYNPWELANKIYTPSYVSLQTVLEKEGLIFQPHKEIFLISYLSRKIEIDGHIFIYRKINGEILTNPIGIDNMENSAAASKERAFVDAVFLYKDYHLDNPDRLDWDKVNKLLPIYHSKELEKRIKKYV